MSTHYRLLAFLLVCLTLVSSAGAGSTTIQYETNESHFLGEWGVPGSDLSHFNGVSHVFRSGDQLIISDTGNSRVLIVDLNNWSVVDVIDKFEYNGSSYDVGKIYQTVRTEDGTYYSVVGGNRTIGYDQSGRIQQVIQVPLWQYGTEDRINIAVDITTTPDTILLAFGKEVENDDRALDRVFVYNQTSNQIILEPIASSMNDALQVFSYSESGHPQYMVDVMYDDGTGDSYPRAVIATFSDQGGKYGFQFSSYLPSDASQYRFFLKSCVFFGKGYWLSEKENYVYTPELNYSGILDELGNLGELPPVDTLLYLPSTQEVVFASSEKNVVGTIRFEDVRPVIYSSTSSTRPFLADFVDSGGYIFLRGNMILIYPTVLVLLVAWVIYRRRRKGQGKRQTKGRIRREMSKEISRKER